MATATEIEGVYRALLGRPPNLKELTTTHAEPDLEMLLHSVMGSTEWASKIKAGALWTYTSVFDPVALAKRYEDKERAPVPGHLVNFLGVATNVGKFFPSMNLSEGVEGIPLPNNWHTDIAEVGAALRAVDLSGPTYTMVELGCGWGCWMNLTGAAARASGKEVFLIGVEADEGHLQFAREAMATNRFEPHQFELVRGIAAGHDGAAFFPRQHLSGEYWGLEPIFDPPAGEIEKMRENNQYDELEMMSLAQVISKHSRIDLLHIDIQGGEVQFLRETEQLLKEKVAYVVVGTHSRVIDGQVIELMTQNGWELEMERATLYQIVGDHHRFMTLIDGVQGWRNRALSLY